MPTNHTPNYSLSQWEPNDQVRRTDFNADNAKIDAALKAADARADALAESKADVTALELLAKTVTSQSSTLNDYGQLMNRLGNCRISSKTFSGGGGSARLTFPGRPLVVFVLGETASLTMAYGLSKAIARAGGAYAAVDVTWDGRSVSWTGSGSVNCNTYGMSYVAIALIDAES